ncbi:hypothetical protein ACFQ48_09455 [Hymenobacter caeli]|uniref:Uncharacterized protein n=1 Tax=Hymenobacter caeli TaxID=2735894 RepID=A0ABX2FMC0_9BACT|nr:hypothetical protein [Hymenobacter caeli]NRT18295.1 hypothetical protein [Hymenobacter caeli]
MELPVSLEVLQEELQRALPEYSYTIQKQLFGKTLMAKQTGFRGARIALTKKEVTVGYGIPSVWGNALVANLGLLGALATRAIVKDAMAPRNNIFEYLTMHYTSKKV